MLTPGVGFQDLADDENMDAWAAGGSLAVAGRGVKPATARARPNCHRYISPVADPAKDSMLKHQN